MFLRSVLHVLQLIFSVTSPNSFVLGGGLTYWMGVADGLHKRLQDAILAGLFGLNGETHHQWG